MLENPKTIDELVGLLDSLGVETRGRSEEQLSGEGYYAALPRQGYSSRCEMSLPDGLSGKRVLDLLCRSGKGAYKIADLVGPDGFVLGIDPDEDRIEHAREQAARNHPQGDDWRRTLAFAQGCPEDLRAAGVKDATFDVVVVNSALNLVRDLPSALREIARVLVSGGFLYHAGVFAESPLSKDPMSRLAARGNVFGAARSKRTFERAVREAGFSTCVFAPGDGVAPSGFEFTPELVNRRFQTSVVRASV
ncbi:class I SAM-dependent methyltransferase [Paraeggerthella sp. Marseille-Q4926]|uniref:class I SAM-dependent methyltransferase n=1 Tax=Paraeggerthella sp. Marseille-Q4926 TaxID=2866587 RepID=UPI001CE4A0DE|nr:class I SAM-dependent methyltransferase [Paraeggerthella sp. Marseille-Q4926]